MTEVDLANLPPGPTATQVRLDSPSLTVGTAAGALGFYGGTPATKPNIVLTDPEVQDVIDALVTLGLVTQSDPE